MIFLVFKKKHEPNFHPKPNKILHQHVHLKYILLTLILISLFHTSHQHPTTTKILNTNITQCETHTIELPPITKIAPYTFTPMDTPPQGKLHIHTKYTQHTHKHHPPPHMINTNFIGIFGELI